MKIRTDGYKFSEMVMPIAVFNRRARDLETSLSIVLERYCEDGMGDAIGGVAELSSGRLFVLNEWQVYEHPQVYAEARAEDLTDEGLNDLLDELQLSISDCIWTYQDEDTEQYPPRRI